MNQDPGCATACSNAPLKPAAAGRVVIAPPGCCFVSLSEPYDPYVPPQTFLSGYDLAQIADQPEPAG